VSPFAVSPAISWLRLHSTFARLVGSSR
jgi:hypothetical protein